MQYPAGEHLAGIPEDAGRYSAVMERLPVAGAPPDRTTEIPADMLTEILESRHVSTDRGIMWVIDRSPRPSGSHNG
jgi:hypothetical protein